MMMWCLLMAKTENPEERKARIIRLRTPNYKTEEELKTHYAELREKFRKHYPHNTREEKEAMYGIDWDL